MSTDADNVAVLKDAYQHWHDTKGSSVDHWLRLMTDDVKFRSLAAGAQTMEFTRPASSQQEVKNYFAGLSADWEMIHYHIDEYTTGDDRVVALGSCSFKHKKTGKILDTPKADFHRFHGGKICEFFEFYDTLQAVTAASS